MSEAWRFERPPQGREAVGLGARLGRGGGLRRQAPLRPGRRVAEPSVPRGEGRVVARAGGARRSSSSARSDGELETVEIAPGDAFRFRPGTVHRVTALEDTLVIEVSTPIPTTSFASRTGTGARERRRPREPCTALIRFSSCRSPVTIGEASRAHGLVSRACSATSSRKASSVPGRARATAATASASSTSSTRSRRCARFDVELTEPSVRAPAPARARTRGGRDVARGHDVPATEQSRPGLGRVGAAQARAPARPTGDAA